jgi:hypothetical protein
MSIDVMSIAVYHSGRKPREEIDEEEGRRVR